MALELKRSLESAIRPLEQTGRNAMLRNTSLLTASSRTTLPESTSRIPAFALGAMARDNDGLRKSQSTKMVRPPTCAMLSAKAAAIVDLPSLGIAEVIPTTLLAAAIPFKSAAIFIVRMASAKAEKGCSTTLD